MANRRLGGMGGPQRGNRPFSQHQPFQGSNVSPWQGNMPSNNSMSQSGLLGQLAANPQQLALALSNLLQPQQQQMNNHPPSLLSLNTSPAFSQDRDSFNRFGNRPRNDLRRDQPYYKNRGNQGGGWRQVDSKQNKPGNLRNFRDNRDNRNQVQQQQRGRPDLNLNKSQPLPQQQQQQRKESESKPDNETSEDPRDEEDDSKRDWKEEKKEKTGDEQQNEGQDIDDKNVSGENTLDGTYVGVPRKFLHCFVCNKDMWDGESFQKHVRGRAHKQMLQSLEESFHITVNILRENMRLAEEKKVIELNRMHRLNKNKFNRKFQEPESHCNMCDLKFLGKIIAHRKTDGHQRLKRFLHPNCDICTKEFPSRMEWVDHRLTPEHLRQLNEILVAKGGDEDGSVIIDEQEVDLEPILEESMEMEEEHPILELTDDLNNIQNRMPTYKKNRAVGTQNLKPFTGFMCDICHKSFESDEFAQAHLNTQGHYYAFLEAAKSKYKKQQEEAAKEEESKKRKREEEESEVVEESETQNGKDEEMYDPEEACNEEEEPKEEVKPEVVAEPVEVEVKKEEEVVEEEEEETEAPPAPQIQTQVVSPRTTRRSVVAAGGPAKNGAGPKCKKLAGSKAEEMSEAAEKPAASNTYRIPKVGGNMRGGACPKSKQ